MAEVLSSPPLPVAFPSGVQSIAIPSPRDDSPSSSPSSAVPPLVSSSPSSSSHSGGSSSAASTPTNPSLFAHHPQVVPAYPYNVSMVPFPHSHNGPAPDDSDITTRLPSICVDYLSHDWAEDDVWTSWKAMTRNKSEIVNGVRLENASWRTWAKQRGNLKTISPETLNWLKDSDVTWLYGPLHTAVDAVPPPRVATASERLGLEPLRSLSDSKRTAKNAPVTKPILKYRSLADILLPTGAPASIDLDLLPHDNSGSLDGDYSTASTESLKPNQGSKSESHLVRLGAKRSPLTSPRDLSPDGVHVPLGSDSSSKATTRHISFNHRVEQCIAVDSTEEAKKHSSSLSSHSAHSSNGNSGSEEDDGDDEEEVLTFKSSRSPNFGASSTSLKPEPHTIVRLGPTTLKSVEIYPHPSPVVVYQQDYDINASAVAAPYIGQPVPTYSSRPLPSQHQPLPTQAQQVLSPAGRPVYDYADNGVSPMQWDGEDEEDYGMGFDYFTGPDVGVGDEYDMVSYGSQHLIGNSHNNYTAGQPSSYLGNGPYSPSSAYAPSPPVGFVSPGHSRRSSGNPSTSPAASPSNFVSSPLPSPSIASVGMKGPHSPAASSRDAQHPKRSILKSNRSRENSGGSITNEGGAGSVSPGGGRYAGNSSSLYSSSPLGGNSAGPSSPADSPTSSLSSSPYTSSSSLAAVMATAGIPSRDTGIKIGPGGGMGRRSGSEEIVSQVRGRSASRSSTSSLERSASADRRSTSSGSLNSPGSSYSPPSIGSSPQISIGGVRPIGIPGSRRGGSSDSLSAMSGSLMGGRGAMPDLVEASSESETDTVVAGNGELTGEGESTMVARKDVEESFRERLGTETGKSSASINGIENSLNSSSNSTSTPTGGIGLGRPSLRPSVVTVTSSNDSVSSSSSTSTTGTIVASSSGPTAAHGPVSPPLVSSPPITTSSLPTRHYHPSPSLGATTYSTTEDDILSSTTTATSLTATEPPPSLSNSPKLDPTELASIPWSDEVPPALSYARRSLLRAARGNGVGGEREDNGSIRGSIDSGRGSTINDDYGFGGGLGGYYEAGGERGGNGEQGIVNRTMEVAGTARDLLGALSKGLWNFGRRASSSGSG